MEKQILLLANVKLFKLNTNNFHINRNENTYDRYRQRDKISE